MKQKDIVILAAVVVASIVLSILASNAIFKPSTRSEKVEVVEPISADFPTPDPRFFNKRSVDPTQQIQIGGTTNNDPFKGSTTP